MESLYYFIILLKMYFSTFSHVFYEYKMMRVFDFQNVSFRF